MIACTCWPLAPALGQTQTEAVSVEPAELARRQ